MRRLIKENLGQFYNNDNNIFYYTEVNLFNKIIKVIRSNVLGIL